jgi:hypothetical protein
MRITVNNGVENLNAIAALSKFTAYVYYAEVRKPSNTVMKV